MAHEILIRVVERASTDAAFRTQLASDPARALAGYDLTAEERAAVLSADPSKLQALGVDARLTKQGDTTVSDPWASGGE